ncbi:MAG: ATP-binding protein [Streptosporangiaceae bacterium]|jgi:anti-sigma regulatory factor (Ser/Thr protein kinase)
MRDPADQALSADVGTIALPALPASPSWARRYTRFFLDSCQGISPGTTEDAELIVSELATNAVRFGGARPISLSLRNFREVLLVEIYDSDSNPPVLSSADSSAESGRGLMLVNALSKEWSYSFPPGGGKIVYCFLAKT